MQSLSELEVRMKRIDPRLANIRMDKQSMEDSQNIFQNVVNYQVSYLIRLQRPEFNRDFPDELPLSLEFHPKTVQIKKRPSLESDAGSIIGNSPVGNKRRSRYTGTYNIDEAFKKSVEDGKKKQLAIKVRNRVNSADSAGSSSTLKSSSSKASKSGRPIKVLLKNAQTNGQKTNGRRVDFSSSTSDSSDSDSDTKSEIFPTPSALDNYDEELKKLYLPAKAKVQAKSPQKVSPLPTLVKKKLKTPVKKPQSKIRTLSSSSLSENEMPMKTPNQENTVPPKVNCDFYLPKPVDTLISFKTQQNQNILANLPKVINHLAHPIKKPGKDVETPTPKAEKPKAAVPVKFKETKPRQDVAPKKPLTKAENPKAAGPVKTMGFKPPPIIEPPKLNPRTFKPVVDTAKKLGQAKKLSKPANGVAALGGIFTINNGWDKNEEKKKKVSNLGGQNFTIPKIQSNPAVDSVRDDFDNDVEDAHNVYSNPCFNLDMKRNLIVFQKAVEPKITVDKFNRRSNEDEDEDEDLDDLLAPSPKDKSMFSDSDDEPVEADKDEPRSSTTLRSELEPEATVEEQVVDLKVKRTEANDSDSSSDDEIKQPRKRQRLLPSSDNESENTENQLKPNSRQVESRTNEEDDDYESLFEINADPDDLEDSEDEFLPPNHKPRPVTKREPSPLPVAYTSALDELKLTFRKEVEEDNPETAAAEFVKNTNEIIMNMTKKPEQVQPMKKFNDHTERVFQVYFVGTCLAAYEERCDGTCGLKHNPPVIGAIRHLFNAASLEEIENIYGVAVRYQKLFEHFCGFLAEMFIKLLPHDYEPKIARIIMDCEKNQKTREMYRSIVQSLVVYAALPRYKAVRIIINHHIDSTIAQEVIFSLILDTGADLVRFMDYLFQVNLKRRIPDQILEKIIINCNSYQSTHLPSFCLDNLIQLQPAQLRNIKQDELTKFVRMQCDLIESNNDRRSKAAVLGTRISALHLQQSRPQ